MQEPPPLMPLLRREEIGLRVSCLTPGCRPMTRVPLSRLPWPDHYTIRDAPPRLRCLKCGATNPDVSPDWKDGPMRGYHYPTLRASPRP